MSLVSVVSEEPGSVLLTPERARYLACKRAVDVSAALMILFLLLPILLIIACTLKALYGGPVTFKQQRLGYGGRYFGCLKFRTMRLDADNALALLLSSDPLARLEWATKRKLTNDPRIHPVGKLLRVTNLDELPQLFNVLRGDMSLVGPRPIVDGEIGYYGKDIGAYTSMRPGVTGMWQVNRTSLTTYEERVSMDVRYSQTASMALDVRLILRTAIQVLAARGSG